MDNELFKNLRICQNINQKILADKINLTQSTLSRIEQDLDKLSISNSVKILDNINLTLEDLPYIAYSNSKFKEMTILAFKNIDEPVFDEIKIFYEFFKKNKDNNLYCLMEYFKAKKNFSYRFPEIVESITRDEIINFKNTIKSSKYHSHIYYEILNCISLCHIVTSDELKEYVDIMYYNSEINLAFCPERIKKNMIAVLNNLLDISFREEPLDFKKIEDYFQALNNALIINPRMEIEVIMPYYQILIDSKFNFRYEHTLDIQNLVRALRTINAKTIAKAIELDFSDLTNKDNTNVMDRILWT
ncbi:helix-turn-helix domain-containing protein [Vagococcus xieshaowenii]|uniref:XRE family transcriptional regulator n=1 Tax=Vagococcus xieshaowenii TaxID=2562451 RepID=A0AAJ5EGZ2_9ENTE|nr:helix-turn-helix transcriptional regulator [Vagococcus xieshaowenii]QCA29666.1 XRE family transcriptional regulator [Vagococcus xieshaowenii]TFZ42941.1 XRE family transcriptional regulator [Vagococcus xieshaowenii]